MENSKEPRVLAIILGGGKGTRLYPLTKERSKPAVPFGGKYRIVDIPISNCINSGYKKIYLLTQFNSASLHHHITNSYSFDRFSKGFVEILAAEQTLEHSGWFEGTADAVRKNFIHFRNTNEGALTCLYEANNKVMDYNKAFDTNFSPLGLKFGDYIFTADEKGNIDVMMKTNVFKPYLGVGFGKHIAQKHRLSVAFDLGLIFWGSPKFMLNNGKEIKSSGKEAGITQVLSWLKAWPNFQIKLAYKIF